MYHVGYLTCSIPTIDYGYVGLSAISIQRVRH